MNVHDVNGKNEAIVLHNAAPFEPDWAAGRPLVYRVQRGTAYHFAVERRADGADCARSAVATYRAGELFCALPAAGQVHFVLTGALHTAVEPLTLAEAQGAALAKALQAVGAEVPQELYQAVAEVLAYVYRLKNRRLSYA